jgi:Kef-type K+ transport system membrane component KefB/nucleotide-binding universal stress UspA family protein
MIERLQEPVAFFLLIMSIILITPLLSERVRLPGIVGIILGGVLIGPHGFGLLEAGDRIEFLATIGLVYLMFSAGLEVDINQFMRVRGRAVVFGVLTFMFPQLMGMGLGWLLGLDWLGAVLLGSAFASHTLIAFPILTQLGVTRNEAVAVTTGATVLTDIGAFIILAVVLGARTGGLSFGYFLQLFVMLSILALLIVFGLPRLGKFFFQHFSGRAIEFQFVIVALFVAAFAAELIGVHEVVGAFLAGLAINATLPRHSPVTGHVLFIGESFFIPVFLLYSGMITDPLTFLETPRTVVVALGVTVVAYVSKFIAAWITGRLFNYTKAELGSVFGLSHAQAAVTIPTLVIGLQIGLFDTTLFNAAILMILVTSITSPLLVQRFAPGLHTAVEEEMTSPLFDRILVPVSDVKTQEHLLGLASLLAHAGGGKLMVLSVAKTGSERDSSFIFRREQLGHVHDLMHDPDTEIELIPRLEDSYARGILHTAIERNASLIVLGWRGSRSMRENFLGSVLDEVTWGSDTPVMVSKLTRPLNGMQRVLLILPPRALVSAVMRRILDANLVIARELNVPLSILADPEYLQLIEGLLASIETDQPIELTPIRGILKINEIEKNNEGDLIVIPGFGSRQRVLSTLGNFPERLAASFSGNLVILHFDK